MGASPRPGSPYGSREHGSELHGRACGWTPGLDGTFLWVCIIALSPHRLEAAAGTPVGASAVVTGARAPGRGEGLLTEKESFAPTCTGLCSTFWVGANSRAGEGAGSESH